MGYSPPASSPVAAVATVEQLQIHQYNPDTTSDTEEESMQADHQDQERIDEM